MVDEGGPQIHQQFGVVRVLLHLLLKKRQSFQAFALAEERQVIGIGGSLAAPPLPHHRTYGSVYGGSRGYANALRLRTGDRAI
jgi:hypothetical protein